MVKVLHSALRPAGAACRMEAEHLCMTIRGARKRGAKVVTVAYTGTFNKSAALRAEFLGLIGASGSAIGEGRGVVDSPSR